MRRTAILPAEDLSYSPCLLRVPAASLGDLADYGRALKKRGIPYQAVVTKLSFDPDASYPKINFQFERVLNGEELLQVAEKIKEPVIDDILGLRDRGPVAQPATPAAQSATPPAPAPTVAPAQQQAANEAPPPAVETKKATKSKGFGAAPATEANTAQAAQAAATPQPGGDILASLNASLAGLKL